MPVVSGLFIGFNHDTMRFNNLHTNGMTTLLSNVPLLRTLLFLIFSLTFTGIYAQDCDNLTDGGSIIGEESGCNNPTFDPSIITSTGPATGGTGAIEYIWMKTTGDPNSPFNTWQIIPGENGESYDPGPISETTYFGRCSRRSGCTEYVGESNIIAKTIQCCEMDAIISAASSAICTKEPLALSTNKNGAGITYLWEATGGSFDDNTSAVPNYMMMMVGTYTISVTITEGTCVQTATFIVSVENLLPVNISASETTVEVGANLALTGNVTGTGITYIWSSSGGNLTETDAANTSFSSDTEGNFEVYLAAEDENGCSGLDTINITVNRPNNDCDLTIVATLEDAACNGVDDGSINLIVSGGTGAISFAWTPTNIGNISNPTGLAPGSYIVTITDEGGCDTINNFTIGAIINLSLVTSSTDTDCGLDNGTATVSASGGLAPYTYLWDDAANQQSTTATNLTAGIYQVVVTDANGCQNTAQATIVDGGNSNINLTTDVTNATCNNADGSIDLSISGGVLPYTINWDNDIGNVEDPDGLAAGLYNVTVTDSTGCSNTSVVIVGEVGGVTVTLDINNVSCYAGSDGSITAMANGGTGNYTYQWANGLGDNPALTGLAAGIYSVTATDTTGCQGVGSVTLLAPDSLDLSVEPTSTDCANPNGSAIVNVIGGTPGYTYLWSDPSGQTTQTAVNLAPGDYTVTVTDANGCTKVSGTNINGDMGLMVTITTTNVLCNGGSSGTVNTSIANGVAPYSYEWNNSLGNFPGFVNLAQGLYDVTVTDANGCFGTATAKVHAPDPLVVSPVVEDASCDTDDGRARLDVSGGTPDYSYAWGAPINSNSSVVNGLAPGSYGYTVTDANGCFVIDSIIVLRTTDCTPCKAVAGTINTTDPTTICAGDGTPDPITVTLTGNSGDNSKWIITDESLNILELPMSNVFDFDGAGFGTCYIWSVSYDTITGLIVGQNVGNLAGCYELTDSIPVIRENCDSVCTATPSSIRTSDPTVFCVGDGNPDTMRLDISGGSGDFSRIVITDTALNIIEVTSNTVFDFENTPVGICLIWNITYTDSLIGLESGNNIGNLIGCHAPSNAITIVRQDCNTPNCDDFEGSISIINGTGASVCPKVPLNLSTNSAEAGITYLWTASGGSFNDSTSANPIYTMMMPGTYEIILTVNKGTCVTMDTININILEAPQITTTVTDLLCESGDTGAIDVMVSGGVGPYSFNWDNAAIGDTSSATGLSAGTYKFTVTDSNGCMTSDSAVVNMVSSISANLNSIHPDCDNPSGGRITANPTGGTGPYNYAWSNGAGDTATITNLIAGEYTVTLTDANGCTVTETDTLNAIADFTLNLISSDPSCNEENDGSITANTTGGTAPISFVWSNAAGDVAVLNNLSAGTYSVTATEAGGCTQTASVTLTAPNPITASITNPSSGTVLCPGTTVNLSASPNDSLLSYNWTASGGSFDDANSPTPVYTVMAAGNYTIVLTIISGNCTSSDSTQVEIGDGLDYVITKTDLSCAADNDGSISVTVNSGALPITYTWDNGIGNISNPTGLSAGTYHLTITDANNCTARDSVVIATPSGINLQLTGTDILCNGAATGSVDATVSGGSGSLTLSWSNGETGVSSIDSLLAGTYSLTVTDSNGCAAIDSVIISEPTALTTETSVTTATCTRPGSATVTVSGGTAPYTYLWNDATAQTTATANNLSAGNYTVTITDANGCTTTATVTIIEIEEINCSIFVINGIETINGIEGVLGVNVAGGDGNYTYSWNNGGMDSVIRDLSTNTYIVTITDGNGCECADTIDLENPLIIGDFVFQDLDSNGIQDVGEPGLEGAVLQLTGTTFYGTPWTADATTDAAGLYEFVSPPGDYKITVIDVFNYDLTDQDIGADDAIDSDFNPVTFMTDVFNLVNGDMLFTFDLGVLIHEGCKNVLTGGSVKANETMCGPSGNPTIITSVQTPTGGVGPIEYLWLSSHKPTYYPGDPDWIEIPNSNAPDYDPGLITKTTYFIRCARRAGCNSYPGETNIITKELIDCATSPSAENLKTNVANGQVELIWEGKVPVKDGQFIIERSTDGIDFQVVSTLSSPVSPTLEQFHYMDESPYFGENYYRIITFAPQMEKSYSNVAMAMVKPDPTSKMAVYPNPVSDKVTIHFLEELGTKTKLQIISAYGQVMKTIEIDGKVKKYQLDLGELANGIYYLQFDHKSLKHLGQRIYKVEE